MPLPRLFTQFPDPCCSLRHCLPLCPPYFSHNFIFYPPSLLFLLLFLYFPSFPRALWVATFIPLLSPCVPSPCLDPPFLFTSPSLPSFSSNPASIPVFLSFSYFTLSPPFPCLLVFLTSSSPPPCISSNPPPLPHPPLASLLQSYNCGHDGP